jgi:hypothetical protein
MKSRSFFLLVLFFAPLIMFEWCCDSRNAANGPDGAIEIDGGVDGGGLHAGTPFQTGPVQVTAMYPVDMSGRSNKEWVLLTALQGIVAKHSPLQLFLYDAVDIAYFVNDADEAKGLTTGSLALLYYLAQVRNPPLQVACNNPQANVWMIVEDFKQYLSGYVLYTPITDPAYAYMPIERSRNIALTQCGLEDGLIPVTQDQYQNAEQLGLTRRHDFTKSPPPYMQYIIDNLSSLNRRFALDINFENNYGPFDYAIMLRGMIFDYFSDQQVINNTVLPALGGGTAIPVFNYGPSEGAGVKEAGSVGDFVVAADYSHNLSLLSSTRTRPATVINADPVEYECNKTYVTFVVSDGDNIQILANTLNNKIYYGSDWRGKFPIGWTIAPALYYLAPDVWNFYVKNAVKNMDEFVAGPSTIGYVYENVTANQDGFSKQLEYMNSFMAESGVKTSLVFTYDSDSNSMVYNYFNGILGQPQIAGAFYHYWGHNGNRTPWFSNKPITQDEFYLDPSNSKKTGVNIYKQADFFTWELNYFLPPEFPLANGGFHVVYAVRNYSDDTGFEPNDLIGALARIYNGVDKNKVQVVTPSQFVDLQKQYLSKRANTAFHIRQIPSSPVRPGGCVTFVNDGLPPETTIDWFTGGCEGTPVPGGASPTVCPLKETIYYWRVRNTASGCVDWACNYAIVQVL